MNQAEQDLLVLTAQNGDQQAFGLLYKIYNKALIGFSFKLSSDRDIACDSVQEAWIKAAKNIRKLNDPRAFKSWVYRLVRWKTMDMLRQVTKTKSRLEEFNEESFVGLESSTENIEQSPLQNNGLSLAIKSLPETEKQIIHLFYLDEMKITEVSIILEIPVGTVKSRLNRARKRLKEKYQQLEN